jgi:ferric-dicitrate binding protein FerR (iron transport regulator)
MKARATWALLGAAVAIAGAVAWAAFGGVLRPRAPAPRTGIAHLTTAFGEVSTRRSGTFTFLAAQGGEGLDAGDSVRTGEASRAVVTYQGGSQVHVDPGSLIVIVPQEDPGVRSLRLESGALAGEIPAGADQPGQVSITDPAGDPVARIARVDPAQQLSFRVRLLDEVPAAEVSILRGDAEVSRSGRAVRVRSGQTVELPRSGDPGAPTPLLSFPEPRAPAVDAHLEVSPGVPLVLSWSEVPGAAGYRVQVALQPGEGFDFTTSPAVDSTVQDASLEFEPHAAGTYAWRVASVDPRGREGEFGFARRFVVDAVRAPAQTLEPITARVDGNLWSGDPPARVLGELPFGTGTRVQARPAGELLLAGATLGLSAGARLQVTGLRGTAQHIEAELALASGALLADLPASSGLDPVRVHAGPATLVLAAGSRMRVELRAGLARVSCERGEVEASGSGRSVKLGAGEVVDVGPSGPGARMRPPEPPAPLEPAAHAQVGRGLVRFAWQASERAANYRLQVFTEDGTAVEDRVVAIEEARVRLSPGSFRWSVTAVDTMGLEGASAPRPFDVIAEAETPRPPRITIVSPAAGSTVTSAFVDLEGRTAPGVQVSVNHRDVGVDPGGLFRTRVPLEPGANSIEVSARDPSGRSSSASLRVRREVP